MKKILLFSALFLAFLSAKAQDSRGIPSTSTQATTGQVMQWDGVLNTWKPATPASGGANTAFGIVAGNIRITDGAGSLDLPVISVAPVQSVVAGTGGVTVTSASGVFTVNNTDPDQLLTNEGALSVTAGTATTSVIHSNTSGSTDVTINAGTGLSISEVTATGNITVTNSAPDQTVSLTGAGINVVTGTYPTFTVTATEVDGSTTNEGSLTVAAGTATTSIINSNTSGQTGVTITAGAGISIAETGNVITLTASGNALTTVTGSTSAQANTNYGGTIGTEFLWDDGFSIHRMTKK